MNKDWTAFNLKALAIPMTALICGVVIGFGISHSKKAPSKSYPIEVQCFWQTNGYSSYPTTLCDSIKGDTLWRDGNKIVTRNIINVSFK